MFLTVDETFFNYNIKYLYVTDFLDAPEQLWRHFAGSPKGNYVYFLYDLSRSVQQPAFWWTNLGKYYVDTKRMYKTLKKSAHYAIVYLFIAIYLYEKMRVKHNGLMFGC